MGFYRKKAFDGKPRSVMFRTEKPYNLIALEGDDPVCRLIEDAIRIREERDKANTQYKKLQKRIAEVMAEREATVFDHPDYQVDFADWMKVQDKELIKERCPEGCSIWSTMEPTVVITKKK